MLPQLLVLTGLAFSQTPSNAQAWRGADPELDRLASEFVAAADKGDPLALARLYLLTNAAELLDTRGRLAVTLERVRSVKTNLDPLLQDHVDYARSEQMMAQAKLAEAAALRKSLGLVTEALVLGPFDNAAGAGHGEAYPPEKSLDPEQPVDGRDRPIYWQNSGEAGVLGVLPLGQLVVPAADATAYVLVAIRAEKETLAALRIGTTDAAKAWLGGVPVLDIERERRAELDQDSIPVTLSAGWTPLLVKVSWSGKGGRALIRLTAPKGGPLAGVTTSAALADVKAALVPGRKAPPKVRAKHTVARVDDALLGAKTAEQLMLRSNLSSMLSLYDAKKLPIAPILDLEKAIELTPGDPWLHLFFAYRIESKDKAQAETALRAVLAIDPGFAPAHLELAELASASDRRIAARASVAEAAKDASFEIARLTWAEIQAHSPLERTAARALLESAPPAERTALRWSRLSRLAASLGDRPAAVIAARAALEKDYRLSEPRSFLLSVALDKADVEGALALVQQQIDLAPSTVAPRLRRVRLLAAGPGGIAAARAAIARDLLTFPENIGLWVLDAELALSSLDKNGTPDKAGAVASLDKALAVNPQERDVRRHRAALTNTKGELEDELTVDPIALAKNTPVNELEKSYGAAFLMERTAVRLYDNGSSTRFVQTVLRLSRAEVKDLVRGTQIPFSPSRETIEILSAERIRPSGEVIKASRIEEDGPRGKVSGMYIDQRWKSVDFEDLEPGDLVHVRYRIDTLGQNIFGGFFGEMMPVHGRFPKHLVEMFAQAPADHPLFPGIVRAPLPTIKVEGGVMRASWRFTDVPPIEPEPMSPSYSELGSTVGVSTYSSWEDLGRWFAHLFRDQMELDAESRAAGRRAIAGAKDDGEKIRKLYDYVVKNTRYVGIELGIHGWKPFKASEVHRRRYGDCKDKATLLAALLRDNGIEATVALIRTTDRGPFPTSHATMWAFNHAITYVPSLDLYLDGTAEKAGSGELPYQDQGAFALVVWPDGRIQLDSPPESSAAENLNRSSYQATLAADGTLSISGEERFFGARASAVREEHSEPRTRKEHVERALSQIAPGAAVDEVDFSDLDDLEAPPSYRYKATLPRYADAMGDKMIVPLTLFPHQVTEAYGDLGERKTDLVTTFAWSTQNVVRYTLPPGATIAALPEGATVDTPYVSLVQKVRALPGGFETDDTVTLKSRRVPKADYPAFRAALLAIDRALERKVVVKL